MIEEDFISEIGHNAISKLEQNQLEQIIKSYNEMCEKNFRAEYFEEWLKTVNEICKKSKGKKWSNAQRNIVVGFINNNLGYYVSDYVIDCCYNHEDDPEAYQRLYEYLNSLFSLYKP